MYSVDENLLKPETRLYLTQNPDKLTQVIEIGVMVLTHVQTSQDVDFVKNEFDKLISRIEKTVLLLEGNFNKIIADGVQFHFDPSKKDSYSAKMVEHLRQNIITFKEDTERKLTEVRIAYEDFNKNTDFDKETSPIGKLKKLVTDVNDFITSQFDETNTKSFVSRLKSEMDKYTGESGTIKKVIETAIRLELTERFKPIDEQFVAIREILAKKQGEEEMLAIASAKGFIFEDELFVILQEIAKRFGDSVEESGLASEASTGSKKGDFLYYINKSKDVIVIEAKDKKILLKPSMDYMKETLASRNTPFGILVSKQSDQLQEQIGTFGFYNDNTIITHSAFITESIRFAKAFLQHRRGSETDKINTGKIKTQLDALTDLFKVDTIIKNKLTQIDKTVTETTSWIRTEMDKATTERKNAINVILEEIEK